MSLSSIRPKANLALVALASLAFAVPSFAQVTNGSFETGTYSGWGTAGDKFIATSAIGSGPTDGSFESFLATATDGTAGYAAGTGVSSAATFESFLGLPSGAITGVGNGHLVLGSAINQTFTIAAGQTVTFDWDFLTNQTYNDGTADSIAPSATNDDFSFASLSLSGGGSQILKLADVFYGYAVDSGAAGGFDTGFTITPVSNPFISETGFHTFSWTASTSGTYTLGIGVVHATTGQEDGVNSGLLIDNVVVTPEPATIIGLAGLCFGVRRRLSGRKGSPR